MSSGTTTSTGGASYCDPATGSYGYNPSLPAGILFSVLFGLFTLFFLFFTIRTRLWYLSIVLGAFTELLGWIARAAAHNNVCNSSWFTMQITCTILAPAFFSAALYIILGILIARAPELSRILTPKMYLWVFCTADFFSLLLQAIGGGIAASSTTNSALTAGTDIMIAGIFLQLAAMTIFSVLFVQFVYLAYKANPRVVLDQNVLGVSLFCTFLIMLRNIYRAVELIRGWNGYINTHQRFIIGLDAVPMVLVLIAFAYLILVDLRSDGILSRKHTKGTKLQKKPAMTPDFAASVTPTTDEEKELA